MTIQYLAMMAATDLPIDIYFNKLVGWLIDRKWVPADYHKRVAPVKRKIATALAELPDEAPFAACKQYSALPYFECFHILDTLKELDASTKNMLGYYSSARVNTWQDIVTKLANNRVFLADCGAIMQHDVNYEVTAIQKKMDSSRGKIKDSNRKEADLNATAAMYTQRFKDTCRQLGIKGDNIEAEIQATGSQLPAVWKELEGLFQATAMTTALEYHRDMCQFLHGSEAGLLLRHLGHLNTKGNTSVHEFATGEPVAVDDGFAMAGAQLSSEHTGIDFGDSAESGVIDFGDGADTIDFGEGIDFGAGDAIDFGDGADTIDFGGASSIDFGGIVDVGDGADTIDFGDGAGIDFGDVTPASVPVEGIAQSILHHGPTRAAVCDELHELRSFLKQRVVDLTNSGRGGVNIFSDAPVALQKQDASRVKEMVKTIEAVVTELESEPTQRLILINSSPRYIQRLVDDLSHKLAVTAKSKGKVLELQQQRAEASQLVSDCQPQLKALATRVLALKANVEAAISKLYDGRKVNIIGEINHLLELV